MVESNDAVGSHTDAPSGVFTSAPVHVVSGLDKQTGNLVQSGQTCTGQAVFAQEYDGSASFEQAGSIQENSGHANSGHLELSPAIEVQNDERCAQTNSGQASSGHLELSPAIEVQNNERCAQTGHVDSISTGEHGASVEEGDVTST
ncbi:hypothetical protein V6N11_036164 [Hibiscus sabdariffa]|uniref:Uncharacterized protein n=1 Tax=Hibiscus sabdariffa TaxID=183260 RepID=A0ABR2R9W6_9ROSI